MDEIKWENANAYPELYAVLERLETPGRDVLWALPRRGGAWSPSMPTLDGMRRYVAANGAAIDAVARAARRPVLRVPVTVDAFAPWPGERSLPLVCAQAVFVRWALAFATGDTATAGADAETLALLARLRLQEPVSLGSFSAIVTIDLAHALEAVERMAGADALTGADRRRFAGILRPLCLRTALRKAAHNDYRRAAMIDAAYERAGVTPPADVTLSDVCDTVDHLWEAAATPAGTFCTADGAAPDGRAIVEELQALSPYAIGPFFPDHICSAESRLAAVQNMLRE